MASQATLNVIAEHRRKMSGGKENVVFLQNDETAQAFMPVQYLTAKNAAAKIAAYERDAADLNAEEEREGSTVRWGAFCEKMWKP